MTTAVIGPVEDKGADVVPSPSLEQVREFIRASKADSTLRGYKSDWRHFCQWCDGHGLAVLPASPETVASYIAECAARLKVGSIQRRLNAIAEAHKVIGLESPTATGMVRNTLKGIKRTMGTATVQKAAALTDDIRAMLEGTDAGLIGLRDRALVLLGFAGAFRRAELVGLDLADLDFNRDGLTVTLRRSKTDQDGQGRKIGVPYGSNPETCPVRVVQTWLEQKGVTSGSVFRSINRSVELFVAPKGTIRYTLDGSEPRDGTVYEGPIAIDERDILLRAFAEAEKLETKTEFKFVAQGKKGVQIEDVKPGRLVSRTGRKLDSRGRTFEGLKQATEKCVTFEGVVLTVGQGSQIISVSIGEIPVDAAFIEALLAKALEKFKVDTPVTMTFRKAHFASGHDLRDFAIKLGIELQQAEVEQ